MFIFKGLVSRTSNKFGLFLINVTMPVSAFKNLTGDANQERFTDGLTEEVIADLANFPELFVIASNTVFTYKGQVGKYFLSAV